MIDNIICSESGFLLFHCVRCSMYFFFKRHNSKMSINYNDQITLTLNILTAYPQS